MKGTYCDMEKCMNDAVLIISGGSINADWLQCWIKEHRIVYCIAADKGLETAYKTGIKVDYILGDYDSVDSHILDIYKNSTEVVAYPPEKDYTDTHIAVKKGIEVIKSMNAIDDICLYVAGATGTRIDHTMTNIYVLDEALEAGINAYIIDEYNKVYIKDKEFKICKNEQYGKYVSFIPMTEKVELTLKGMKYLLSHYVLTQGKSICQSNEIIEEEAIITINGGKIVVVESHD